MIDYTNDYLLDKKVKIFQPVNGYRASTDAVLLSSLVRIKNGDGILDVGSGTGAVSLCLAHRLQNLNPQITGLEIQPELAELSNASAQANGFSACFLNCDIRQKVSGLNGGSFDHVITNPPYAEKDMPSPYAGKATAHNFSDFTLTAWINICLRMTKPQGYFYIINRAEAIDEILTALHKKTGDIQIIPVFSKPQQNAKRIMIIARKASRSPAVIHQGITIHTPDGTYTPQAQNILRKGAGFFESD